MLPPTLLQAKLSSAVFDRKALSGLPAFEAHSPESFGLARRGFLLGASAALLAAATDARALTFSPDDTAQDAERPPNPIQQAGAPRQRGEIPSNFWELPRELWLRRHETSEEERLVYWKDGQLQAEGYWRACAVLRDRQANIMTAIDPTVLDVLRGIHGYYEAWQWRQPIVVTSGYRSKKTNTRTEGAAKNSMHLYGKAVDLYVPGIPSEHVGKLGKYLQQGGVGFYPSKGFTHLDTGKLRTWRG